MKGALVALVACGCSSPSSTDIVGPFTGTPRRFVVDRMELPQTGAQATSFGDDLDDDGTSDNQLGVIFSALVATHDASTHAADMIASGALASSLVIQADSLEADAKVGVTFSGVAGDDATVMGGAFINGTFASNRSRTTHVPGAATVVLPVFADADPVALPLHEMELDLTPDGAGGYDGLVRGGIPIEDARAIAYGGVAQMMAANPTSHLVFARVLDLDHDGMITSDEIMNSSLLGAFLVADLHATNSLSIGFAIHVVPCDAGPCLGAPPVDTCHDRLQDGTETDIDCGGSCLPCPTAAACLAPGDCQSASCDAGHCRAPTCNDNARDGFESDVDCGAGCAPCQVGQVCATNTDCSTTKCSGGVGTTGTCAP